MYDRFFRRSYRDLVREPNGRYWWHSLPLPTGDRIRGAHPDPDLQFKMWDAFGFRGPDALAGQAVLDLGANDGFFTVAAALSGAARVTGINTADWWTYPHNIRYAVEQWGVAPEVLEADFRTHPFDTTYDVILFLGVLYHTENVFEVAQLLRRLLADDGVLFVETQLSKIDSPLPLFEYASDVFPTVARQDKGHLSAVGVSNYLFPNHAAVLNLAASYDFDVESLDGPGRAYLETMPTRGLYKFTKKRAG